jgi:hypothetical protein
MLQLLAHQDIKWDLKRRQIGYKKISVYARLCEDQIIPPFAGCGESQISTTAHSVEDGTCTATSSGSTMRTDEILFTNLYEYQIKGQMRVCHMLLVGRRREMATVGAVVAINRQTQSATRHSTMVRPYR